MSTAKLMWQGIDFSLEDLRKDSKIYSKSGHSDGLLGVPIPPYLGRLRKCSDSFSEGSHHQHNSYFPSLGIDSLSGTVPKYVLNRILNPTRLQDRFTDRAATLHLHSAPKRRCAPYGQLAPIMRLNTPKPHHG